MRLLLVAVLSTAACAGTQLPAPSAPLQYSCDGHTLTRNGDSLAGPVSILLERHADDGDVFVSTTGDRRITVPHDPRRDAIEQVTTSEAAVQRTRRQVCRVHGGYSDMLVRYTAGVSLDQLAAEETHGDRDAAYQLVRRGLLDQQSRLHHDR
ncbi:MAG: hypothetical protein ABI678_04605 [Kofleriaceae bacterium]